MATLKVWNRYSCTINGIAYSGKHGASTLDEDDPFEYTVDGDIHGVASSLAANGTVTLWDEDNDTPTTWKYAFFWADRDVQLQFICQATNFIVPMEAYMPFVLPGGAFTTAARGGSKGLGAADTTAITTPTTLSQYDSVILQNMEDGTVNYAAAFID